MAVQTLFKAKALGPGSSVWIVPEPMASPEVRRLDWYLNFQLAKAVAHKRQSLSPELRNILLQNEIPEMNYQGLTSQALMIAARRFLPADMVVMVPTQEVFANWMVQVKKIWTSLGQPSLRIFLPQGPTVEGVKQLWPDSDSSTKISIVPT